MSKYTLTFWFLLKVLLKSVCIISIVNLGLLHSPSIINVSIALHPGSVHPNSFENENFLYDPISNDIAGESVGVIVGFIVGAVVGGKDGLFVGVDDGYIVGALVGCDDWLLQFIVTSPNK